MIKNIQWFSRKACYSCPTLIKAEHFRHFFKNIEFHENPSSGSQVVPCGQMDRHDKANSLSFCNFVNMHKNEKFYNTFTHEQPEGIF